MADTTIREGNAAQDGPVGMDSQDASPERTPPGPSAAGMEPMEVAAPGDSDGEASAETVRSRLRTYAILAALYLSIFISALDQTIVATAIPSITAALDSSAGYVWIGSAYMLANAVSGPLWARGSDIWGRKPALLAGIVLFAASSVLAARSTSMAMLIASRALQGTAGGGLLPLVTIAISDLFSVRRRALYLSLAAGMWALAGTAGPLVGGALTNSGRDGWRWIFWINLPVCAVAFVLMLVCLDVHNPRTPLRAGLRAVDWWGTAMVLAATALLLVGLDLGGLPHYPWHGATVLALVVVGAVLVGVFVYCEIRLATYPLMPLRSLFARSLHPEEEDRLLVPGDGGDGGHGGHGGHDGGGSGGSDARLRPCRRKQVRRRWRTLTARTNTAALCVVAVAHAMVAMGTEYYLPMYFQGAQQASPLRSGVLMVPMLAVEAAGDLLGGLLLHQTGRYCRELMWAGSAFMVLGGGLLAGVALGPRAGAGAADAPVGLVMGCSCLAGLGFSVLYQAPTLALQNALPHQADTAPATATLSFLRNVAQTLALVLGGGVVFQNSMNAQQPRLAAAGLDSAALALLTGDEAAAHVSAVVASLTDPAQRDAVRAAFGESMRDVFWLYMGVAGLSLAASLFVMKDKLRSEHTETRTGVENMQKQALGSEQRK